MVREVSLKHMKYLINIFLALFFTCNIFSQSQSDLFLKALINKENVLAYIDKDELQRSQRLGISYTGVEYKALISFDIDESIKNDIKANSLQCNINEEKLEEDYFKVTFSVPFKSYSKIFYLKSGKFVSPSSYFSRDWKTIESKYFIFKIREPKYFNDYCIKKLDEFIDSMSLTLNFDEQQMKLLEKEKIYYILCKDENEIEQVTGFNTRGIYIIAFDEIITTYNTHYHELAHLLINYKLKNLSLYTLPFFMEGFAVAIGGRGGISKNVVLDMGWYLQKSGFMVYDSIISNEGFYNEDASMTYPLAGLYNAFLMKNIGIEKYLELYRFVNGSLEDLKTFNFGKLNLPANDKFIKFLKEYEVTMNISVDDSKKKENGYLKFSIDALRLILPDDLKEIRDNYVSKKYNEVFYKNADEVCKYKYGITADSSSISVYNFYTNDIIASYSVNFSIERKPVQNNNGKYEFYVKETLFDTGVK